MYLECPLQLHTIDQRVNITWDSNGSRQFLNRFWDKERLALDIILDYLTRKSPSRVFNRHFSFDLICRSRWKYQTLMLKIWLHLIGLTCFWVEICLISVFSTALLIWFCHIWSLRLSGDKTMCDKNTHMPPNMFQFLVFGDCSLYYSQIDDMKWNVWWRICSSVKHCSCSAQLTPEKKVTYTHIVHPISVLTFEV